MSRRSLVWAWPLGALLVVAGAGLLWGDRALVMSSSTTVEQTTGPDATTIRALLVAMRGTGPVACEMSLNGFGNWGGNYHPDPLPDRDTTALRLASAAWQRTSEAAALDVLGEFLTDPDPCARRLAARILGRSGTAEARDRLLGFLRSDDPALRQLAATGLGFGPEHAAVTPPLVQALGDRDPGVRAAAAWALGAAH